MLCEICKKREATIHLNQTDGDVVAHSDFCEGCFEAANPKVGRGLGAVWQAGCKYCGGEPAIGGLDAFAALSGASQMSVMCQPCADEFHRFLDQKWPTFSECARSATVTQELIASIKRCDTAAVIREAEEHMRKWIEKTGSE
jgi:protein-arginine kinase activator protein McsA